ncbi:hypothetical protein GCM10011586_36280 [Silvibacterium dinghuense]|nr:hypothetical protein GCM10011586_36280 [Silvibacterium dinghuense]
MRCRKLRALYRFAHGDGAELGSSEVRERALEFAYGGADGGDDDDFFERLRHEIPRVAE